MVNFAISRSGGTLGAVSVGYVVTYHAVDGADHTASTGIQNSGTVSFSLGESNVAVRLNISKEGFIRANSVFRIKLTSLKLEQPGRFCLLDFQECSKNEKLNRLFRNQ